MPPAHEPVLWDILEEHLDEAGFLGAQWERALFSPSLDLAGVASGVERRLCAHLDGLLIGGPGVADRLLLPALGDDDPDLQFAAALALLASPHAAAVVEAWSRAPRRTSLTRALAIAPATPNLTDVRTTLTAADASLRAAAIDVLGFHRALQPQDIESLRTDRDVSLRQALVRAAGRDRTLNLHALVAEELHEKDADRLTAALTAAALLALPDLAAALPRCLARTDPAGDLALLLTALTAADPAPILDAIARPAAVHALGFTGSFAAAEACVHCIRDDRHPGLALEALTALTGVAFPHRKPPDVDALPDLADDDLTADIAGGPEDELPLPDREAVLAWWHDHHQQLSRPRLADPDDRRGLLLALHHASMRRRHALALRLAIVTGGDVVLETRAPARRQLAAMNQLQRFAG